MRAESRMNGETRRVRSTRDNWIFPAERFKTTSSLILDPLEEKNEAVWREEKCEKQTLTQNSEAVSFAIALI